MGLNEKEPEKEPMTRESRWLRSRWGPLALVTAVGVGYLVVMGVRWGGGASSWPSYLGVCVAAALGTGAAGVAVRRATGLARSAWVSFAFAALAWLAGSVIRASFEPLLGHPTAPSSLADLFYLLSTAGLIIGFARVAPRPRHARSWARLLLDVWICAASIFCLGWVALLAPLYRSAEVPPTYLLLDLSYPIVAIVAFCLIVAFLLRAPPEARRMLRTVFVAMIVLTLADIGYAVSLLDGSYTGGGLVHIGWVVGYLFLAAAPWVDPLHDDAEGHSAGRIVPTGGLIPARGIVPAAVAGITIAALAGMVLLAGQGRVAIDPVLVFVGGSGAIALLVRLGWLLLDNLVLIQQLDTSEQRFRSVVRSEGGIVLITDVDGLVHYVSGDRQRLYGYEAGDITGSVVTSFIHPEDLPQVNRSLRKFVRRGTADGSVRVDCRVRAADGTWHHVQCTVSWHAPTQDRLIVIARDVSDQVALQEQLDHLTFHDGLTGLPNRAYFEERTREVIERRGGTNVAVLFLDLDGFTAVNDSVGHVSGDHVLGQAARRLRVEVQADNTVARFGGDEFAVLVETHGDAQSIVRLAEGLVQSLSEPFHVADRDIALTASVGIVFGTEGATTPDLLRNADIAMSRARRQGGARVEVFAASMHADVVRRLELGTELRQAINEEQFVIEYQPLVDLDTSRVTGVEALVRWWRDGTLVPPEGFIRHAEESGLIVPIGEWVLREACQQMARWRSADWHVGLCVNLSPRQVTEPGFVTMVADTLADSGLSPGALTLEVTEDVLVDDAEGTVQRLCELRSLGVRLAIDDFGTGYASLAYLRQLPVDTLKVDPSFVSGLGDDAVLTLLTRTVVRLGQDLGLLVVAEGIEQPEQLSMLREMNCPRGQGFLVARPMAARGVESLLRTGESSATEQPTDPSQQSALPRM